MNRQPSISVTSAKDVLSHNTIRARTNEYNLFAASDRFTEERLSRDRASNDFSDSDFIFGCHSFEHCSYFVRKVHIPTARGRC